MNASMIERLEATIDHAASALLAASVAFAGYRLSGGTLGQLERTLGASCLAVAAYALCRQLLVKPAVDKARFAVTAFEPAELETAELEELVLTPDMIHSTCRFGEQEPLVLDDILAELGPDSRVVRLFDPSAMPTPGHLKARIDDHLGEGRLAHQLPDASRALSEALAELRRSLG